MNKSLLLCDHVFSFCDILSNKKKKLVDFVFLFTLHFSFGLSKDPAALTQKTYASTLDSGEAGFHGGDVGQQNELYREEQVRFKLEQNL